MKVGLGVGLAAGLTVGCDATPVTGPTNRLVIIAGQSNALGICDASAVTEYANLDDTVAAVQMIERGANSVAEPLTFVDEGPRDLGPRLITFGGSFVAGTGGVEMSMMRDVIAGSSDTWFVGKFAVSGSSLISHWNDPAYPLAGPSLYSQLLSFIQAQVSAFDIVNLSENLVFVWIQGTADVGNTYANYLAGLQTMFRALRADLAANFRVMINRLESRVDSAQNVRAAEEAFAQTDTDVLIVHGDDLALRDAAHYTDDSYALLGGRFATSLLADIAGTPPTNPYYVEAGPITVSTSAESVAVTLPPHQAGDIIVVVLSGVGQNNYSLSGIWTQITNSPQHDAGSGANARIQAWWTRATDSATANPTIADVASDGSKMAGAVVIRGAVPSGDPFEDAQGAVAASGTAVSCPTATTSGTNRLILNLVAFVVDNTEPQIVFDSIANSSLTGIDAAVNKNTASGAGAGLGVITGRKVASGAVSATTATLANAGTQAMLTLAVKP